jgi:uncharacterized RDD family membrane protein YckC
MEDSAADSVEFPGRRLEAAGPLRRGLATLVDMVVFLGLSVALILPVARRAPLDAVGRPLDALSMAASDTAWLAHVAGVLGLWIGLWWCYFLVGWGLFGWTPGKGLFGLRVTDEDGRIPIGPSRAALRLIAYTASATTLGWGHTLIWLRSDRRALHDLLAGTRVVKRPWFRRQNRETT